MININALEGIECPNCESGGPFRIVATATFFVTDNGTDEFAGVEWDDDALCSCVMCGDTGTVDDFKIQAGELGHDMTQERNDKATLGQLADPRTTIDGKSVE